MSGFDNGQRCSPEQQQGMCPGVSTEGIHLIISRWSALNLAIENQSAGPKTYESANQLQLRIYSWFTQTKGPLYIDDLEDILDYFMVSINVEVEDGSIEEVAAKLMDMHECMNAYINSIQNLRQENHIIDVQHIKQAAAKLMAMHECLNANINSIKSLRHENYIPHIQHIEQVTSKLMDTLECLNVDINSIQSLRQENHITHIQHIKQAIAKLMDMHECFNAYVISLQSLRQESHITHIRHVKQVSSSDDDSEEEEDDDDDDASEMIVDSKPVLQDIFIHGPRDTKVSQLVGDADGWTLVRPRRNACKK